MTLKPGERTGEINSIPENLVCEVAAELEFEAMMDKYFEFLNIHNIILFLYIPIVM